MAPDPLPEPGPALKDLMASVGYLLLYWGHTERRLAGLASADCVRQMAASSRKVG